MTRWAIPDIHGEFDKLVALLGHLPSEDQLIFLGDYVDRGPVSRKVLQLLRSLQGLGAIVLRGNHESLMIGGAASGTLRFWRTNPADHQMQLWLMNGGGATIRSYEGDSPVFVDKRPSSRNMIEFEALEDDVEWLKTLPLWHEDDDYFYSHAPVPPHVAHYDLAKSSLQILTWSYFQPERDAKVIPGKIGVCGHIHDRGVTKLPRLYEHYLFLDAGCGCYPDAPLVAYNLDEGYYLTHKGEKSERRGETV